MSASTNSAAAKQEALSPRTTFPSQAMWLCLIVVMCLTPFAGKAFHIDDPLFVWTAKHILHHPLDPYGFTVNWNSTEEPMSAVAKNPPLCSYYLGAAGSVLGWRELSLHASMMLPAALAVVGTFLLASRLCPRPFEAALCTLLAPVFLVSATGIMCDVMMLAFWVWAIVMWMRGIDENRHVCLTAAAVLVALGALTKYYAVLLLPLLFVYGIIKKKRPGLWAVHLLLPIAALAAYAFGGRSLYDRNLLAEAAAYSTGVPHEPITAILLGLAFTGGCLAVVVFYAPRLWSRWALLALVASAVATAAGLLVTGRLPGASAQFEAKDAWLVLTQFSIMSAVGLSVIALTIRDLQKRPGADSALLALWVLSTFCFASFVNWTVNGRSLLPMAPVVAILIMREISTRPGKRLGWPAAAAPLVLTGLLSLSVAWADYTTAAAARSAAYRIASAHCSSGRKMWFSGHWGFQYYMQQMGAKPIDDNRSEIPENSTIVVPILNTQLVPIPKDSYLLEEEISLPVMGWIGSMCEATGAAFYSSEFGPLPYVIGPQPPHPYCVLTTTRLLVFRYGQSE